MDGRGGGRGSVRRGGRVLLLAVALVGVLGAAGACGSSTSADPGDDTGSGPSSTSTTPAPASSDPSSDSASDPASDPSSDPSSATPGVALSGVPEVAAATGPLATLDGLSVRMPAGFVIDRQRSSRGLVFADHPGDQLITVSLVSSAGLTISLDQGRRDYIRDLDDSDPGTRPDVLVDGKRWWHVAGETGNTERVDAYGTSTPDFTVSIEVHGLRVEMSQAKAAGLVASMLPTVRFTG